MKLKDIMYKAFSKELPKTETVVVAQGKVYELADLAEPLASDLIECKDVEKAELEYGIRHLYLKDESKPMLSAGDARELRVKKQQEAEVEQLNRAIKLERLIMDAIKREATNGENSVIIMVNRYLELSLFKGDIKYTLKRLGYYVSIMDNKDDRYEHIQAYALDDVTPSHAYVNYVIAW